MGDKETINDLNQVIQRLMNENAQTRRKIEEAQVVLRRRAPNAAGLTLASSIKTILDDRDKADDRIAIFRLELKKALDLLNAGSIREACKRMSLFLFSNRR